MIWVNDFKRGLRICVDKGMWKVIDLEDVKGGKGWGFVGCKLGNLRRGGIEEKSLRGGEKVEEGMMENGGMEYLYGDGDKDVLMDKERFDEMELGGE